jgi:hypothetical protein
MVNLLRTATAISTTYPEEIGARIHGLFIELQKDPEKTKFLQGVC